jgi:hypothetical protein
MFLLVEILEVAPPPGPSSLSQIMDLFNPFVDIDMN